VKETGTIIAVFSFSVPGTFFRFRNMLCWHCRA